MRMQGLLGWRSAGVCTLGRFIFHQTQFFPIFVANPVPWDVNNKTMPSSPIKTAFSVRAREMKF